MRYALNSATHFSNPQTEARAHWNCGEFMRINELPSSKHSHTDQTHHMCLMCLMYTSLSRHAFVFFGKPCEKFAADGLIAATNNPHTHANSLKTHNIYSTVYTSSFVCCWRCRVVFSVSVCMCMVCVACNDLSCAAESRARARVFILRLCQVYGSDNTI